MLFISSHFISFLHFIYCISFPCIQHLLAYTSDVTVMHEVKETSAHCFLSFMSPHFSSVYFISSACIHHLLAYTFDVSVLHELEPPPSVSFLSWHLILSLFILFTVFHLHTYNIFSHTFQMLRCCTNSRFLLLLFPFIF